MFKTYGAYFGFALLGVITLCLTYIPMIAALFPPTAQERQTTIGDRFITIV